MPKYENVFLVMDTETGGLPSALKKQATIEVALTEVAAVAISNVNLQITDKKSWLIKPYADDLIYEKGAEIASGISKQMCMKQGIDIELCYKELRQMLQKHTVKNHKPIIVFQNKAFDIPFIENLFLLFSDDLYKYIERIEDTMHWARLKWVEKPKFSLGAIAEYFGLDHTQAHRALPDAIITAECWIKFIQCLRSEGESKEENKKRFRLTFRF
jgi:DNA polymerase III epsilon subunit-like protein